MFKKLPVVIATMIVGGGATAHAATCEIGYWLNNGGCEKCVYGESPASQPGPWYCPGDDTQHECPHETAEMRQIYEELSGGKIVASGQYWTDKDTLITGPENCIHSIRIEVDIGRYYTEGHFNGTSYWNPSHKKKWYQAANGYYLSGYQNTTYYDWYNDLKQCTNAPAHARYTGPGTPDEPVKTGGATDYNDCPWECDCGYVRLGDACVPAGECTAGVKTLRTGTGLIYKLYSAQTTSPTIAIGLNGNVCYACLAPGAADGALNLKWDAGIFHAVNAD